MVKGQDIVVLAFLLCRGGSPPPTLDEIAKALGISVSAVHRSLGDLSEAQLIDRGRAPSLAQVDEFLSHALRYLFPPRFGGEVRGIPTAGAAPPLREQLAESSAFPLVWAHPEGRVRGVQLEPLHPSVPRIAARDPELGETFALIDALRLGDARLRELGRRELHKRFMAPA